MLEIIIPQYETTEHVSFLVMVLNKVAQSAQRYLKVKDLRK